ALRTYEWGPTRAALLPIDFAVLASYGNVDARQYLEGRLLEVLASDAPRAAKDYVCRQLCAMGTVRSVQALAALLDDVELAHMARAALEDIPDDQAAAALRDALLRLKGDVRVGVIHSLGSRGDVVSVPLLAELLHDEDQEVAGACVAALSRIPAPEAAAAITSYLEQVPATLRQAAADAALRIARRLLDEGKLQDAAAIYRRFETSDRMQLRCAAFQGLLKAEPEQAMSRWVVGLSDGDQAWQRFVAQVVYQQADDAQLESLCGMLSHIPASGQTCLLDALSTRRHSALRTAALMAIPPDDPPLRLAGLRVLANSGEAADVPLLAKHAMEADPAERELAERGLIRLQAPGVDEAIIRLLDVAEPEQCVVAIRALIARRTPGISPKLVELAQGTQDIVRLEALVALQSVAGAVEADTLVSLLADAPAGKERDAAERAVAKSCAQISPVERQPELVLMALTRANAQQRSALLPALGRIGGAKALDVIQQALQDPDAAVQNAAIRGLCNWPDATVADQLLELARTAPGEPQRIWALRGYARVIALPGETAPEVVTAGLREAMQLAARLEERQLIVSRLKAVRCADSLALAVSLLADKSLQPDAVDATVVLAEGMKGSHPQEARAALEQAAALTQDAELQLYIAKLLWNMQLKEQQGP
ncbi:MAG: HEAT repeat domain-containing protein, partial [Pirellulaceae bacterium]